MKSAILDYRPQVHYFSNRLRVKLKRIRDFRTTFIEAPSGAGKTTAVQGLFESAEMKDAALHWFTASEEPHTSGWGRLCRILADIDRSAGSRLLRLGFPVEEKQGEIAQALMELSCDRETYLVCDNFQFLQKSLPSSVWRALVDHGSENLRIVILTQHLSSRGIVVLSNADVLRIENEDLCLRTDEIGEYYGMAGVKLDREQMRDLYRYSEGWIAALYLQLMNFIRTGSLEQKSSIYELVNELLWKDLSGDERRILFRLSPFDNFTVPQACFLLDVESMPDAVTKWLDGLMFVRYDMENRRYFLHAILLDFVRSALRDEPERLGRDILYRAGEWCADRGEKTRALTFFYHLRDYPAILSLELHCADMTRAVLDSGQQEMLTILRNVVENTDEKMRRDHAFTMISMAFEAFSLGDVELYGRLCAEMKGLLENCDMEENLRRSLLGELYLAQSFGFYNDIEEMGKDHSRAYDLLGPKSVLFRPDSPWTFGWPSVLGMFHSAGGELDNELEKMDLWLPRYNTLTSGNGSGADLVFRAEALFHRGIDDEAESVALKALDVTQRRHQDSLYICTTFLLERISLLRGNGAAFTDSGSIREESSHRSLYAMSRRISDLAAGFLSVSLNDPDGVPPWICGRKFLKSLSPAVPFACMVCGRKLLLSGGDLELMLRSEELLFATRKYRNLLSELYIMIYISVAQSRLGREAEGMATLRQALDMAMPDGLLLPFAENADLLGPSLDSAVARNWSSRRRELSSLKKRYHLGKGRILKHLSGKSAPAELTEREHDVALLVSEGMGNREIAKKLFLSENTVKFYLKSIFQKLGIHSRRDVKKSL